MQEDQEIVREFLFESQENLLQLDQDMIELEARPKDESLLASVFRTLHTIKGTCGFLGFSTLERISHRAEGLLSLLRDGKKELTPELVTLILETVDATRKVLLSIEATGQEGVASFDDLVARLQVAAEAEQGLTVPAERGERANQLAAVPSMDSRGRQQPESGKSEQNSRSSSAANANIRVGVGLLDKLMDLVGELVLTRNQILQFTTGREGATLNSMSQRLNLITSQLQEKVMKTRMQPVGTVWNQLPRIVRDLGLNLGKQISLEMDGSETELDRTVIEAIKDPLVHLVRNACDHGIETPETRQLAGKPAQGKLLLHAYHEGGQVNIEISDDGAGINVARVKEKALEKGILTHESAQKISDREALNLIFNAGFSTAAAVSNISGRGVGMDVVRTRVESIGGLVDIASIPGHGTTVKLKIPLTLAIIPGLIVSSGEERFVIPQVSLLELIRLERDSHEKRIEYVHQTPVYRRRGTLLPIAYLNDVLGLRNSTLVDAVNIVVLHAEDRQFGLVVDGIYDTQEIVVKPLSKLMKGMSVYAGATIMGDGRVALILDVMGVGERSGVLVRSREELRDVAKQSEKTVAERQRLLLFRSGSFERIAVPLSLVGRLEEFLSSQIESSGGGLVVQYRNRILPLVNLRELLGSCGGNILAAERVPVIVFRDGDRSLGLIVDQVVDIVDEAVAIRQRIQRKGFLGSAVVGERVTDFLDVNAVLAASAAEWSQQCRNPSYTTVLIAEPSSFVRAMVRNRLEMNGYHVVEAANLEDAKNQMGLGRVDAVLANNAFPPSGSSGLRALLRQRCEWEGTPVLDFLGPLESAAVGHDTTDGKAAARSEDDWLAALARVTQSEFETIPA